jgi:hypothetical protein
MPLSSGMEMSERLSWRSTTDAKSGHCGLILFPYHSWSCAADGTLHGAPEMHTTEGFDPAQNALVPLRLERWAACRKPWNATGWTI